MMKRSTIPKGNGRLIASHGDITDGSTNPHFFDPAQIPTTKTIRQGLSLQNRSFSV